MDLPQVLDGVDRHAVVAVAGVHVDVLDAGEAADLDLVVAARALVDQLVDALAEVDLHAVVAAPAGLEVDDSVVPEVDLAFVQGEDVVAGRAGDAQRALLDPGAAVGGHVDELALAVGRLRALEVAADALGEVAGELRVLERGDEQQVPVERHRAAEQALARLLVVGEALLEGLGADAGHLEQDAVDRAVGVEGQHGLLEEAPADGLGDVAQLVLAHAVDVEAARALERELVAEEDAVEQLGAARAGAAVVDDPLDAAGEVLEAVIQPRVVGVGDGRGVVGGEDLRISLVGGCGGGRDGQQGKRGDEGSEHRGGSFVGEFRRPARRRGARGRGRDGS